MAEGFAKSLWSQKYDCYSAGTEKHGMNQRAMKVMSEINIDLSSHYSKTTADLSGVQFDYVVTVCDAAKESCPFFAGGKIVHIGFQDPPKLTREMSDEEEILKIYRRVRDEIKDAIKLLPNKLEDQS